jgi:hypothetical protein
MEEKGGGLKPTAPHSVVNQFSVLWKSVELQDFSKQGTASMKNPRPGWHIHSHYNQTGWQTEEWRTSVVVELDVVQPTSETASSEHSDAQTGIPPCASNWQETSLAKTKTDQKPTNILHGL